MFDQGIIAAAKEHAVAEFPREACGIIVGNEYIPCVNKAEDPEKSFEIDPDVTSPHIMAGALQAIVHSHPFAILERKSSPSLRDMRSQVSTNVPWGIIDTDGEVVNDPYWLGDHLLDLPLIGVEFQHGVTDCYHAVRRWYWQVRGIKLPEVPRDDMWWMQDNANLYVESFEAVGFYRVDMSELRDGDLVVGKVQAEVLNHGGVYLDNPTDGRGLIFHHLPGRLSRREPAGPWVQRAELALRYAHAD